MADQNVTDNTPEYIAYRLMNDIKTSAPETEQPWTKDWVLNTYAECLFVVRNPHTRYKK